MTLEAGILYYTVLLLWNSFNDVVLALSRKVICLDAKNSIFMLFIWSFMVHRFYRTLSLIFRHRRFLVQWQWKFSKAYICGNWFRSWCSTGGIGKSLVRERELRPWDQVIGDVSFLFFQYMGDLEVSVFSKMKSKTKVHLQFVEQVPGAIAADYLMAMRAAYHIVKWLELIRIRNTCFCFFIFGSIRWPLASVYEIDITFYRVFIFILSGRSFLLKRTF